MTRDEIIKECNAWSGDDLTRLGCSIMEAYLAAAEPRESRIAELEKDVADSASAISAIHQLRMDAEKRIADLAADRDEWRHKHENLRSDIETVEARIAENEKCLGELSTFAEMDKQRIAELERERDRAVEVADAATKGVYSEYMLEAAAAIGKDLWQGFEINSLKARLARVTVAASSLLHNIARSQIAFGPSDPGGLDALKESMRRLRESLAEEQEQKP
jgi:chromosome segregation ATPase